MGEPQPHADVCLVVGMLTAFPVLFSRAATALSERFGPVIRESETLAFDFTTYYEPRMGRGIKRKFFTFERLVAPERMAEIKLRTNDLERRLAGPEFPVPRPINLDPGYVTHSKLVLATTKDYSHRIYLGQGIYAEVTLRFVGGHFEPMPWTYPDYRTEGYRAFFDEVRADFMKRSKQGAKKLPNELQEMQDQDD